MTTAPVGRITERERIAQLDVLRGLAILLILFMNVPYMGDVVTEDYLPQRLSWTAFDQAWWWVNRLLDGTQRGLLELLFGAGVLIMARTAMTPDGPVAVADLHIRRNLWLAAFGIANGVILFWEGDILLSYGCAALLIFPFRTLRVRQLLIIGIAMSVALWSHNLVDYIERVDLAERAAATATTPAQSADRAAAQRDLDKYTREVRVPDPAVAAMQIAGNKGSWTDFAVYRVMSWAYVQFTGVGIFWENVVEAFAAMLIGMALFKTGIIQGKASRRTYWWLLGLGYGIGWGLRIDATIDAMRFSGEPYIGLFTHSLARLPIVMDHIGAVALLLQSRTGARLLAPFQATGRLPLTTYLGASLVAMLVFGPLGGQFAQHGYGTLATGAALFMALQLAGANLWLRNFANGPVEWLWKSLGYNRRQPFRRGDPLIGAEATS
ncbi:DUF418 domain-containing protein [Glacieibacterium frigidum]|uniref:DUF418 domain-containing protein n=1 Tax=Glacieibacterium frigidum TaxID=2593303 RepID=A0A552U7E7_9SPHN|nr:DUF418 domain-containing protein [Glacieibacterium frigidum]TRW14143.1 DUF418 domain-containing protein [Glacieibacterium frigidum]